MASKVRDKLEIANENAALKRSINEYRKSVDRFNVDPSGTNFRHRETLYNIMCGIAHEPTEEQPKFNPDYHEGQE
jgi:hypothetical protein